MNTVLPCSETVVMLLPIIIMCYPACCSRRCVLQLPATYFLCGLGFKNGAPAVVRWCITGEMSVECVPYFPKNPQCFNMQYVLPNQNRLHFTHHCKRRRPCRMQAPLQPNFSARAKNDALCRHWACCRRAPATSWPPLRASSAQPALVH